MAFKEVAIESLEFNPFTKISKEWMLVTAGDEKKSNTMTASWGGVGIMWGKTGRWKEAAKKAMPFILFTMLLNDVNGLLHFWCFWLGYSIGFLRKMFHRFS